MHKMWALKTRLVPNLTCSNDTILLYNTTCNEKLQDSIFHSFLSLDNQQV